PLLPPPGAGAPPPGAGGPPPPGAGAPPPPNPGVLTPFSAGGSVLLFFAESFFSSLLPPETRKIVTPTIAARPSAPAAMMPIIAPLPFFFVGLSSSSSSSSSRRFLGAPFIVAPFLSVAALPGLVFSVASSSSATAATTAFVVVFVGALVSALAGGALGFGGALFGWGAFCAPEPNAFFAGTASSSTTATITSDSAGTLICALHDVQRIVFPARLSGTSNAELHPAQVIGMDMCPSTTGSPRGVDRGRNES
ncbi:MAG: hypothetical protein FJ304_22955, partial [Planctomycetes bacterium]|nr:hypothetical protein [Planctomycetota bacterium]